MIIRKATVADDAQVRDLFLGTVTSVNCRDYNEEQIRVWSSSYADKEKWLKRIREQYFLVGEIGGKIAGMASLTMNGYLDILFTHKDFQGQGIAAALLKRLESEAAGRGFSEITSDVSITARPFFEHRGFKVIREQHNWHLGIEITNYRMSKSIG